MRRPSGVQVDGVDLTQAAVDASALKQEAVIRARCRARVAPTHLPLEVPQQVKPWGRGEGRRKRIRSGQDVLVVNVQEVQRLDRSSVLRHSCGCADWLQTQAECCPPNAYLLVY